MSEFIRLVIVDDHTMLRETWKMVLERVPGIDVIATCTSGEEAIAVAAAESPDVMLMDINMSPVNGFEATRRIALAQPNIKIIGFSINNLPSYARNIIQLGAKGYITKNVSPEEMRDAIHTVYKGEIYICREVREKMPPMER